MVLLYINIMGELSNSILYMRVIPSHPLHFLLWDDFVGDHHACFVKEERTKWKSNWSVEDGIYSLLYLAWNMDIYLYGLIGLDWILTDI